MSDPVDAGSPLLHMPKSVIAAVWLLSAIAACERRPTTPSIARAAEAFQPYLTTDLTPAFARARFGTPDEQTGSGLRIYVYRLEAGKQLWLGFPGDAPIVYAKVKAADGTVIDLPLRSP
jgi:hypothetical protein